MEKRTELYDFIQNLSKSEKGYFKKYVYKSGLKENNYLNLFNSIEEFLQKNNETIKEFEKSFSTKYLDGKSISSIKNYLFELLTKTIVEYHSKSDIEAEILQLYSTAKILMVKNLFLSSHRILNKAIKKAQTAELFEFENLLLALKYKLFYNFDKKNLLNAQADIEEKHLANRKLADNYYLYQGIYHRLYHFATINRSAKNQQQIDYINNIVNVKELDDIKYALSNRTRKAFYTIKKVYHFVLNNELEVFKYGILFLQEVEKYDKLTKKTKAHLAISYFEIAQRAYLNYLFKLGDSYLNKMKAFGKLFKQTVFDILYLEILSNYSKLDYESNFLYKDELIDYLKNLRNEKFFYLIFAALNMIIQGGFVLGAYKEILELIKTIKDHIPNISYLSAKHVLLMYEVLCHYEINDYTYLPYLIRNNKRSLQKIEMFTDVEKALFDCLKRTANFTTNQTNRVKIFKETLDLFRFYENKQDLHFDIDDFKINAWLKSKINNTTLIDENKKFYAKDKKIRIDKCSSLIKEFNLNLT